MDQPAVKSFDRWSRFFLARNRRAETPGFRRRAALAAAPARALGTNQNLAPLVLKGDPFQRRKPALAILL